MLFRIFANNKNEQHAMNNVLLIYTGGTIGMGQNPLTGALEPLDFNHLEDSMPEFKAHPRRHRCISILSSHRLQRYATAFLGTNRTHHFEELQPLRRFCHTAWHRHHGLHSLGPLLHAGKPYQAGHTHRLTVAHRTTAHRRQGESHHQHRAWPH